MPEFNQKVYDKAIQLLVGRLHTTGELFKKLKHRGFDDHAIRPVLKQLEELQFLDDERFAQVFVENLKQYKDWGYFGIRAKLMQRQIPNEIIQSVLADFFTSADEEKVALRLLGKLKKQNKASYEKIARAFSARGFRSEAIKKALTS